MVKPTSNQQSFIQLMTKSREHARKGFEVLLKREDFADYIDAITDAGLLDPSQNPAPVPAGEPGYVQIPFWEPLNYLQAVARQSGGTDDLALAEKVMSIVRDVSGFQDLDGTTRDNYHTWHSFAEIIGLLPAAVVSLKDVELVRIWLSSQYDRGLVANALDKGILTACLVSEDTREWSKSLVILRYCTEVQWVDEPGFEEKRKKPVTVVDDYWLKKLIGYHAEHFGKRIGQKATDLFIGRLREVFTDDGRKIPSWLYRSAVEEHPQNHSWNGPYNHFVEGLRDVLLGWVDSDSDATNPVIGKLLIDNDEIVRRIAIYELNHRWDKLEGLYLSVLGSQLFDSDHIHELYGLLNNRFDEFDDMQKQRTVDAIRQIPKPTTGENSEHRLKYIQRNWLSAIIGKGHELADTWFRELDADAELGPVGEHPDFHSYMESWSGPGPTPFSVSELINLAADDNIVDQLNAFQQTNSCRGPTTRALADTLEEAVVRDPHQFLTILPTFLKAKRPYQYAVINGYKRLWDTSDTVQDGIDWTVFWEAWVVFIEQLLNDNEFWSEKAVIDEDLPPNRDWIPPVIAELLRSGTRDDKKLYPQALMPRAWAILEILLDKFDMKEEPAEDAVSQAINAPKGKAIEALISHALRECRVNDRETGGHEKVWNKMQPTFDEELAKCADNNFDFSTLLGNYIVNFDYMSHSWLESNLDKIFPKQYLENYRCALEGLAYAAATRDIYILLRDNGIVDFALQNELKGKRLREKIIERIALAYLWAEEELDSPRFTQIFDTEVADDLIEISGFFWSIRGQQLSVKQIDRIIKYWESCIQWGERSGGTDISLLASLGLLSCYITTVGERGSRLLHVVAPHMGINYNTDRFVEELDRLVESNPEEISSVLGEMINAVTINSDYRDMLKSLIQKLYDHEQHKSALKYADKLRHIPGIIEVFDEFKRK